MYVIFLYWNILMKCTHFIFICHWLMLTFLVCGKYSNIWVVCLIINWCWLFFMCKMFSSFSIDVYVIFLYWNILIKCTHFIFDWCLCDFLVLKHIDEVYALHLHLSLTDVYIFCVSKMFQIFQYCFWLFTDIDYFSCANCSHHFRLMSSVIFLYWNILMKCTHFIFICHWLMLTFLFVENILIFQ